ncbi:hypothetical protein LTR94_037207, partial [Friedmanniomyces endolithicus]
RTWRAARDPGDRGTVPGADRGGAAAHLCREPVFRVAPHRRGDRAAGGRAGPARDRRRQPGDRARLAGAAGDGHRAPATGSGDREARPSRPLPP